MGFLDFFRKKKAEPLAAAELAEKLETAKAEATKSFNVFNQKKGVRQKAEEALAALNELEKAKPAAAHHHSQVAAGFKKEYVERVRAALTPLLDLSGEYLYKAGEGIGESLKATAENRYFTQYYQKECEALEDALHALESAFRSLRVEQEKVEAKAAPFKAATDALKEYVSATQKLSEKTGEYKRFSGEADRLARETEQLERQESESTALTQSKKRALLEKINAEKAGAHIRRALKPLKPAFSALAKRGVAEAKPFSLDAENTLLQKGKPALDVVLARLEEKTVEVGDVAVRGLAHAKSVEAELGDALVDYARAEAAREEAERNALPLKALENELSRCRAGLKEAHGRVARLSREMEALVEKSRCLKPSAEESASKALKRGVTIDLPNA
jgi:myosin heavy subunit